MGARTLRDKRKRVNQHQRSKQKSNTTDACDGGADASAANLAQDSPTVVMGDAQGALPDCVRKLYADEYTAMEEGCTDVALFALDPETHAVLVQQAVPQRLVQLLCLSPFDPAAVEALMVQGSGGAGTTTDAPALVKAHKGIVFLHVAAAQALRNVITNSDHDEAIDALEKASVGSAGQGALLPGSAVLEALKETALFHPPCTSSVEAAAAALARRHELRAVTQMDLASALVFLVGQTWELVQVAYQQTSAADLIADVNGPASNAAGDAGELEHEDADGEKGEGHLSLDLDGAELTDAQRTAIEQAINSAVAGNGEVDNAALAAAMMASGAQARGDGPSSRPRRSALYLTLLGYLDELLQLVSVCVEANERVAAYWSEPSLVCWCLDMMAAMHTTVQVNLHHTAPAYYTPLPASEEGDDDAAAAAGALAALQFGKRRETHLCASVLVAAGELVQTLSSENTALMALLGGEVSASKGHSKARATTPTRLSSEQQQFLNTIVSGTAAVETLGVIAGETESILASLLRTPAADNGSAGQAEGGAMTAEQEAIELRLAYIAVTHQLVHFTLALQATLLNVASSATSVAQSLPLVVAVLTHTLPVQLWRQVALPLVSNACALSEPLRKAALLVVTQRLRGVHAAVKVFHTVVSWVCEQNAPEEEDEAAFAKNPNAAALYQSNALYVFGLLLKDVLWMSPSSSASPAATADGAAHGDVMHAEQVRRDQHALREGVVGGVNSEVTTLQFSVLATEVAVWGVSNMLLMMIPATQLGDQPSLIWRAMAEAVRQRHDLLREAAASAAASATVEAMAIERPHGTTAESPAARQMLWLQLESIAQMLWTLQRKQAKAFGGVLDSVNELQAAPADVDLLTRLAWEPQASPALQQSSVGAVAGICCSLRTPEAVTVAVRFAMGMMSAATSTRVTPGPTATTASTLAGSGSLSTLAAPWFTQSAPTEPTARHAWMAGLAALDGVVSVRCEAANALVDMFSDERYDATVYVPLKVHEALKAYLPQVRGYLKRRVQLSRDLHRNYRVVADPTDAGQWAELTENLEGFLDYKRQHVR